MTDPSASSPTHVCVIGFDYQPTKGKARRFEPGQTVTKLPERVMQTVIRDGAVIEQQQETADA